MITFSSRLVYIQEMSINLLYFSRSSLISAPPWGSLCRSEDWGAADANPIDQRNKNLKFKNRFAGIKHNYINNYLGTEDI